MDHLPTISFRYNPRKAAEAIILFARKKPGITKHTTLKLLFFADLYHLNSYGRPIIGDEYHALPFGPVPSTTYDMLKDSECLLEFLEEEAAPFSTTGKHIYATRDAKTEVFSESDIEALNYAFNNYADKSFEYLTLVTHRHPAWANASESRRMKYEDFLIDHPQKEEVIKELAEISTHLVI